MKKTEINKIFDLTNKAVIVTGSAGRLGTEFSHTLSAAGADVILLDINAKKNKNLESDLTKQYHTKPKAYTVDISNESALVGVVKDVVKKYGKIDALINNAFLNPSNSKKSSFGFEQYPKDLWDKVISINLTGVFLCCKIIGGIMTKQRYGVIVNISSIYGIVGADQRIYGTSKLNSSASYAATKGGVVNLTRYLAAYWHRKNIRVNTMSLGGVLDKSYMSKEFIKNYSEKTMLGRMANKDEYNGALLFLVSDASSYMTGTNLVIDGGWIAW